jgi:hypothetical protein
MREYEPKNKMEDPMKDVQMGDVCPDLPCSQFFLVQIINSGEAVMQFIKQHVYNELFIVFVQLRRRTFAHPII